MEIVSGFIFLGSKMTADGARSQEIKRCFSLKEKLWPILTAYEKAGLKLNIQKTKIMASSPITSWQVDGKTMETVRNFIFLGSKITADGDCSHEVKRRLLLGEKQWPT